MNYSALLRTALRDVKGPSAPKLSDEVPVGVIKRAVLSYAPNEMPKSVVAIDGANLFARGKKGVLHTRTGIASSELPRGQKNCIPS